MFRADSQGLSGAAPSVCFVAPGGAGADDAIAQHVLAVADRLVQSGWRAHVLWCGGADSALRACRQVACMMRGVVCTWLDEVPVPPATTLAGPFLFAELHESDRVSQVLQKLHEQFQFDLIEFPERGGLGFRAIQAKQTGQAFGDVPLMVTLHGSSLALRHGQQQWLHQLEDVTLDFAERYVCEHADHQMTIGSGTVAVENYHRLLRGERETQASATLPLVTICVPYFNLGDYLDETLFSLAEQTYPNLEFLVINDGSTDAHALDAWQRVQAKFPGFRFLDQANAGIGATRNRGLQLAQGKYFLPVDADNIAHPDMVRRFVQGMEHNPEIAALTCYFLAFRKSADLAAGRYDYVYKPTGGPHVLGCLQNVYGDGNAMFRTEALRAVGGFETDRDTSFEDWEAFVKLVNAGRRVEVLPDFLFYYRHRKDGFSRVTNGFRNHQRVLRRFIETEQLPLPERQTLWNLLAGMHQRNAALENDLEALGTMRPSKRQRAVESVRRWWHAATKTIRKTTRLAPARSEG